MDMGAEPFEQADNTLSTEGPMLNLVKIAPAVSENKTLKNYTILHMYIAQGQDNPQGTKFWLFDYN